MINSSFVILICNELNKEIAGGRIDKIQQPAKDIIILSIRNNQKRYKLLISCEPRNCRIHLTKTEFESPLNPLKFCTVLRKNINGGIINKFLQLNDDNIISIQINCYDEFGRNNDYSLIIELFNKCPNTILIDNNDLIIDCVNKNRIYPGLKYRLPDKPLFETPKDEIIHLENYNSLSEYLDDYYSKNELVRINLLKTKEIRKSISSAIKRISKKIETQNLELNKSRNRDEIKHTADLILSNIWKIKKSDSILICKDFYNNNENITITLDPFLSPQDYCNKLYKKYSKLKKAEGYLLEQIKIGNEQLSYLYSVLDLLNRAESDTDINLLIDEVKNLGFIKNNRNSNYLKLRNCKLKNEPFEYFLSNGMKVLVGKNNIQNDLITFKIARNNDVWFHVKDYHGSHVVLITENKEVCSDDILECAKLAAEHSELKSNSGVEVNYCDIRYVHRKPNSYPGNVIFEHYRTIKI